MGGKEAKLLIPTVGKYIKKPNCFIKDMVQHMSEWLLSLQTHKSFNLLIQGAPMELSKL